MATQPAVALTTIGGGINRLRKKAAADKNALFDLLNGYVTMSNTVKVRKGSFRNASLDPTTKGLVAFDGEMHTFAPTYVDVPDGYVCHVLTHPSGDQVQTGTFEVSVTGGVFSGGSVLGSNDDAGEINGTIGFALAAVCNHPEGSVFPATYGGQSGDPAIVAICNTNSSSHDDPSKVYFVFASSFKDTWGVSVSYPKVGGGTGTLALDAAHVSEDLILIGGYIAFQGSTQIALDNGTPVTVTFTGPTYAPVPLKEIHFAAPFMGFLYVVAEFEAVNSIIDSDGTVFHYWLQDSSPNWQASTDYIIGDVVTPTVPNGLAFMAQRRYAPNPVWAATTAVEEGTVVEPTVANGFNFTVIATQGANPTTSDTEPVWPTADGATITEDSQNAAYDDVVTMPGTASNAAAPVPNVDPSGTYKNLAGTTGFGV